MSLPSPLRETPETLRPVAQPAPPASADEVLHVEPLFSKRQMPAMIGVGALLVGLGAMLVSLMRPVPVVALPITGEVGIAARAGAPVRSGYGFDRASADRTVRGVLPEALSTCGGLDTLGTAADLALTFQPDGHVAQAEVTGAQGLTPSQQRCLTDQLRAVEVNPFEGGPRVEHLRIAPL